eukprot:CAMPEP_0197448846 /NCGR_PEP_ID=MMETSP1175-20131217/19241_1 /TAXON_ID=1003142 /ORGANISM="Triceratium dubium, Strain CCMP147" /LENGTH=38 /DNA_ID= /DNA_START= /DNA_END= /DNA_ORIENTATION=
MEVHLALMKDLNSGLHLAVVSPEELVHQKEALLACCWV